MSRTTTASWGNLSKHYNEVKDLHLKNLFEDSDRATKFSASFEDLYFDYSKNRVTEETMKLLMELAQEVKLTENIQRMFSGERINTTEDRPVLHTALRNKSGKPVMVGGSDVMPEVTRVLTQMREFSDRVRSGEWTGFTGKKIRNVVNVGIGGSHLGPEMAYEALKDFSDRSLTVRFVSNVDGADFYEKTQGMDPAETLFLIASKTFTTLETMMNARTARAWTTDALGEEATPKHFVAMSTNEQGVAEFGIDPANMFPFWDWVGGRYSLTSSIGLSLMIAIGFENFDSMLTGFYKMDEHFRTAPVEENIPALLALLAVWYNNFFGAETHAILPYSQYLNRLPQYLQQLVMESNGKSVTKSGEAVDYKTSAIVWGEPGTNGQHSFHQLLHQGTRLVPVDLVGFKEGRFDEHNNALLANMVAQGEALAFGPTSLKLRGVKQDENEYWSGYRFFPGNRPSNTILMDKLSPEALGKLIAMYEHKVFTEGVIWDINSFDQFGVELGKSLAKKIMPELSSTDELHHDSSTNELLKRLRS